MWLCYLLQAPPSICLPFAPPYLSPFPHWFLFCGASLTPPLSLPVIMSAREKRGRVSWGEGQEGERQARGGGRVTMQRHVLWSPPPAYYHQTLGTWGEARGGRESWWSFLCACLFFFSDSSPLPSAGPPHPHTISSSFLIHQPIGWC